MQKHAYFIGIGGIGMSALARMLQHDGSSVSGSDRARSELTSALESEGIAVLYEQKAENITDDIDMVVYTVAVPDDHPELVEARRQGIPAYSYPEMLGEVSKDKYTIAVSGTHGKTTTTAMIAKILEAADLDPTVVVGSLLYSNDDTRGSNFTSGSSEYFVVEACEYKRSFTHLNPNVLVITNIEEDHLDYYTDLADIQSAFQEVVAKVPSDGAVICRPSADSVGAVIKGSAAEIIDYTKIDKTNLGLSVPGEHNKENAQAALAAAQFCGVDLADAQKAMTEFKGTWRRFEYIGETVAGAVLYDDYAHHPSEISATLATFREMHPDRRLRVVFQPHLYSRTKQLLDELARSLSEADDLVLAPVYPAREDPSEGVDHYALEKRITELSPEMSVRSFDSFEDISAYIKKIIQRDDVVITMGAGDINTIHSSLYQTSKA